jgi:tetratricopeptide (TPR) repeat protein
MLVLLALLAQLQLADSLYTHDYFEEARVEYLRAFFFYPDLRQDLEARAHYGIALLNINDPEGVSEIRTLLDEHPELSGSIRAEIARQFIRTGRYYLATSLLEDTDEKDLLGLTYLLDGQYSKALATYVEAGNQEMADLIREHLQQPEKSERTAVFLSFIMPGAGEIYAGNYGLGVRDFLLNLGSGYLFYNALRQHKYVDAILVSVFLLNRFYLGSISNAQKSVMEGNEKIRHEWLDAIWQNHPSAGSNTDDQR